MNTISAVRSQFPALERKVYGKPLVYLDNSATTQKPLSVLEVLKEMEGGLNGNIHRAVHYLSARCTERYEEAREAIRSYINAAHTHEILFTSGTTASINMLAFSFGETYIKPGDRIIVTDAEHHSNIVPWQMLCERKQAHLCVWHVNEQGELPLDALDDLLDAKLLAVTHVSNVLGIVNPLAEIIKKAHSYGVPVLVDGAQGIVHGPVDVQALDVDFYAFSGHKLYGPTGTGVLYGKESFLEKMVPWQGGGDMIDTVSLTKGTTYAPLPMKFEAGTANYIGAAALGAAIGFMQSLDKTWFQWQEQQLVAEGMARLQTIEGLRILGTPVQATKVPLFTMTIEGAHPNDVALLLDQMGIAVRSGQLCAEPLLDRFGQTAVLRASFGVYNTLDELEYLVSSLKKVLGMLR